MKPLYSLAELQAMGQPHLKELGVQKLHATSDGQFFILENRARLHAGPEGKVYEITGDEEAGSGAEDGQPKPLSVKDLSQKAQDCTDIEELREMLLAEAAGPNRKSAISAIEARMQAITNLTATHTKDA